MKIVSRTLVAAVAFTGAIVLSPIEVFASERATVTANVNLLTGPGSSYQSLGTVPAGNVVTVYSCRSGFDWCNVDYRGKRGYLAGRYLEYAVQGPYYGDNFGSVGIYLGLPLFWDDYPIYDPPGHRPPGYRPPGDRPPNWRPPGQRPPGVRPPANRPTQPIYRPPSYQRPSVGGGYGGGRGGGFGGGGRGGGGRR